MGTGEDNTPAKPSKPASSTPEVSPTPTYVDWSNSMQAYYGAGATPPFFAPTVASPTPHPYMWGAQHPMMSPYGTPVPYPGLYPPGAVYHHPNMAMQPPIAAIPNPETEGKGANGKERSSAKKLKSSSAAAKAGETGKAASGSGNDGASLSADSGTEGSSDGSDANQQDYSGNKKGSFEQMLADASALGSSSVPGKALVPTNLNIGMEMWNPSNAAAKMRPNTSGMVPPGVIMNDQWLQDERELKRQKRKQSNRESARRSRLRKQAECEELQGRVENLISDNDTLKEELRKISEEYEKLTAENNSMKEELARKCGREAVANLEKCDPTDEGNN